MSRNILPCDIEEFKRQLRLALDKVRRENGFKTRLKRLAAANKRRFRYGLDADDQLELKL